jgi:hypothetical protein
VDVASTLTEAVGYFKPSNTGSYYFFGWSLALSGDGSTLAIGAPYEFGAVGGINSDPTNTFASQAGAVYVFARIGAVWGAGTRASPRLGALNHEVWLTI